MEPPRWMWSDEPKSGFAANVRACEPLVYGSQHFIYITSCVYYCFIFAKAQRILNWLNVRLYSTAGLLSISLSLSLSLFLSFSHAHTSNAFVCFFCAFGFFPAARVALSLIIGSKQNGPLPFLTSVWPLSFVCV